MVVIFLDIFCIQIIKLQLTIYNLIYVTKQKYVKTMQQNGHQFQLEFLDLTNIKKLKTLRKKISPLESFKRNQKRHSKIRTQSLQKIRISILTCNFFNFQQNYKSRALIFSQDYKMAKQIQSLVNVTTGNFTKYNKKHVLFYTQQYLTFNQQHLKLPLLGQFYSRLFKQTIFLIKWFRLKRIIVQAYAMFQVSSIKINNNDYYQYYYQCNKTTEKSKFYTLDPQKKIKLKFLGSRRALNFCICL
eukprot:TRINITY_DN17662_c1_g2_i3.p2 TRINITY_DN17662_c1_g2~~TRINITY_DN17662_c1_g2_i3.p2  ORF type:complete len:244 (+),score=-8.68 TRINITY_DN17662_c1_g2_i3:428-1159(+)